MGSGPVSPLLPRFAPPGATGRFHLHESVVQKAGAHADVSTMVCDGARVNIRAHKDRRSEYGGRTVAYELRRL